MLDRIPEGLAGGRQALCFPQPVLEKRNNTSISLPLRKTCTALYWCPWRIDTVSRFQRNLTLLHRNKTTIRQPQVVVVLTHICEAIHLFPWMHFGLVHSLGHYVDFGSAVLGLTFFPFGYLVHAFTNR